ncbi:MAG: 1-(5-phosphoribosyl)-5-[(5-phosphoribosylamino)methylideneamino]imidazole-4-carboxamide isomerase [Oscillospiraceae bacterium]|jgi:phosphoribosylformimino-5-aminoimidazole carboxamide ribotide isomerase|nr:1-(5-phosphoribosyl)-5-[(5-phosphoribosylamino)methylideneamino]imidazole-4-carboxamide isomerase [Oscillospiraceae bacterium]
MDLYPAIDLRGGKAVRLVRGDYDKMTVYSDAPAVVAAGFRRAGAEYLHLVDLDGARDGNTPNYALIKSIVAESGLRAEVGGGVRSMAVVRGYLDAGAMRVIIGTAAVTDPDFLRTALARYGERIAVAVDVRAGFVAMHGWTQTSAVRCEDFCESLQNAGVKTVICTDISKDGLLQGANEALYAALVKRFSMAMIASGGIRTTADLARLKETGVRGAILGKALYTDSIDLAQALALIGKAGTA